MPSTSEKDAIQAELAAKWGGLEKGGWTVVPNDLLRYQGKLKLDSSQLNVLLNLLRFWWEANKAPFPSPKKIADEMAVSERTVLRKLAELEEKGVITKQKRPGEATRYALTGLVEQLKAAKLG